jgi:hypothetical protein
MPSCPNCGTTVGPGVYFCDGCGQALFDEHSSSPQRYPPPGYQKNHQTGLIDKIVNLNYKAIAIGTVSLLAMVGVLLIAIYTLLPDPRIKVTPPPGWFDAPEDTMEYFKEAWEEEWPEESLDYLFVNNSNNNAIVITQSDIPATADIPDTEDLDLMIAYVVEHREEIKEAIIEGGGWELANMEPRPLACGDIAIYYEFSRHLGGTGSALIVREGSTLFSVYVFISNLETGSEEMEHFCQTISFE